MSKSRANLSSEIDSSQIEETSFSKKSENKKLLEKSRKSRQVQQTENQTTTKKSSPRSPSISRNTDEENESARNPMSAGSQQKLITSDDDTQPNIRANRRRRLRNELNEKSAGQVNTAFEPDSNSSPLNPKENETKKRGVRRDKKKPQPSEEQLKNDLNNSRILAVIVHQTDKLRTDINMYNPIVRVHLIDLNMDGQYVQKFHKDRNILFYYEKENRRMDYVSPLMTTPFDFKTNRSIIPKWEELVVFNEEFNYFIQDKPNVLIMFEIIDSSRASDVSNQKVSYTSQDTSNNWQRIAWAFLKLVGSDKSLNTDKKIRLQLYYSQSQYRIKMSDSMVPEIYYLYKNGPRVKYPASLHVTVKSILPPRVFEPGIRSFYLLQNDYLYNSPDSNGNEVGQNLDENNLLKTHDNGYLNSSMEELNNQLNKRFEKSAIWSRVAGLPCRIPNDKALKLNSAKRGCYSIKFSPSGSYLACACVGDNNLSPIYIYDIPDGKLVMKFQGHFGLVYELGWSKLDKYIVTASNDTTARIIDVGNRSKDPFRILPHPNFIYSAKFHPSSTKIVCTGGYDKVIRVWSISNLKKQDQKYGQLLQELFGHSGYVNSICFSSDQLTLYSADSVGMIYSWNCPVDDSSSKSDGFQEWSLKDQIEVEDIKNQCINHIQLHPNQFRMIVHLSENDIKLIDIRLKSVVIRYKTTFNFNMNVRSVITPCGTFLFSSGADTKVYCWNVDSGDQVTATSMSLNYLKPARDIDFHPYDNLIALCSFDAYSPIYVFKYNSDKATKDLNDIHFSSLQSNVPMESSRQPITMDQTGLKDYYILPNQTDINMMTTNPMQKKLADDVAKFNNYQLNRWKTVQEKLDSVLPSQSMNSARAMSNMDHLNYPRNNLLGGSITLSMTDNIKPEFKYKGPKEVQDSVMAIYDYNAQRNDELDLVRGDEILVLFRESENWWMGELVKNQQQGYFPASYVQEKSAFIENNKKSNIPRYTVKDVMFEYEKVYEQANIKKPENLNQINMVKNNNNNHNYGEDENKINLPINRSNAQINSTKSVTGNPSIVSIKKSGAESKNILRKSEINENVQVDDVNEINEIPTRDHPSTRKKANNRRGKFAHIINGISHETSEI